MGMSMQRMSRLLPKMKGFASVLLLLSSAFRIVSNLQQQQNRQNKCSCHECFAKDEDRAWDLCLDLKRTGEFVVQE